MTNQQGALQYADRDHTDLGSYYLRHVSAMTGEALHSKSAIAAELAHRDREIDRLQAENANLNVGYAAARLEIESLQARIKTMAEEHADELTVAHLDGRMRSAQPAPVQDYPPLPIFDTGDGPIWDAIFKWSASTPGADANQKANAIESAIIAQLRAYVDADRAMRAAQPAGAQQPGDERAAFERWSKVTNQGYDLARNVSGKLQTFESTETEHAWRGFFHGIRASHGQAPAGAAGESRWDQSPCKHCGETEGEHFNARCRHIQGETRYTPTAQPAPAATPQADSQPALDEATAMNRTLELAESGRWPSDWVEAYRRGYSDRAARAPADSVLEDAERLERERICAAIKAEDDYCVDHGDYMLDSDDCIKIVRGEWVRPDFSVAAARKQGANHD